MKEIIEKLYNLYKIDSQSDKLTLRVSTIPKRLQALEDGYNRRKNEITNQKTKLNEIEFEKKKIELDIEKSESEITKYKIQLQKVKSNNDYNALEKQIEYQSNKINEFENREIEILDEIEKMNKELVELENRLNAEEERYKSDKQKISKENEQSNLLIENLKIKKDQILKTLDNKIVKRYLRIKKVKFTAVAVISTINNISKNANNEVWICEGCNSTLPPQIVEEVKMMKKLVYCDACGRLLVKDDIL